MTVYKHRVGIDDASHTDYGLFAFQCSRNGDVFSEPMRTSDRIETVVAPVVREHVDAFPSAVVKVRRIPFDLSCQTRVTLVESCVPAMEFFAFKLLYPLEVSLVFVDVLFVDVLRE